MTIRLTFEIGTNVDIAQVQTQNREKLAEPQLPPEVIRQGVTIKKLSPDLLAVLDPGIQRSQARYVLSRQLCDLPDSSTTSSVLPGVGDAMVFGAQNYSMRMVLDPVRMAQLNLTPSDIANVVREQNRDFPAGIDRARAGTATGRADDPDYHAGPPDRCEGLRGDDRPGHARTDP